MGKPKKAKLVQLLKNMSKPVSKHAKKQQSTPSSNVKKRSSPHAKTGSLTATQPCVIRSIKSQQSFYFESDDTVLLVGEGNFSFAASLIQELSGTLHLTATSYDSHSTVVSKYPDSVENLALLADWESTTLFNIDATVLHKTKLLKSKRFDCIIFNFPHVGLGIKDQTRNIQQNQTLISDFLASAMHLLTSRSLYGDSKDGVIYITVKTGMPYDLWDVKGLAKANGGMSCLRSFVFHPEAFPGYSHRRTIGFSEGLSTDDNSEILKRPSRTYAFTVKQEDEPTLDNDDDHDNE